MPRTVLREFTGGLSSEIDPQNLRQDQGEEALDINLKGFALEPGEGTAPISGGHYFYRGEWITDSKAVSFEESGIGVVKTYNEKRPEFEEIIKDDANISRNLGPPLPPTAVISGTVVSEGTRGERPAEGAHLLKLPETALGEIDKVIGSNPAPSLETYEADPTTLIDDIHYYNGQAYWLVKTGGTPDNWTVVTRGWNSTLGEFTSSDVTSTVMPHNSKGSFFKGGYFVCWDNEYIDSVELSYTSMSAVDTIKTTDPTDNGDAGTAFLPNAGKTASTNFTTGASSTEITGVNIDQNGLITFSQRITTANTFPTAYESCGITGITTANSADERWLRTPSDSSGRGCFLVLMRDGMAESNTEASVRNGTYVGDKGVDTESPVPSVFTTKIGATEADRNIFPSEGWTLASATIRTPTSWKVKASDMKAENFGIKYAVMFVENDSWIRVRYNDPVTKPPEMFIMNRALSRGTKGAKEAVKAVTCSAKMSSIPTPGTSWNHWLHQVDTGFNRPYTLFGGGESLYSHAGFLYRPYQDTIEITLAFDTMASSNNKIHWKFNAPQGTSTRYTVSAGMQEVPTYKASSVRLWSSNSITDETWPAANRFTWTERDRMFFFPPIGLQSGVAHSLHDAFGGSGNTTHTAIWTRSLGKAGTTTRQVWSQADTSDKKNNITTPAVPGKMHRLCKYVRGGATTQQGAFSVSELWTTARFASADNSLSFKEAKSVNFRVGDWIKIGQNGSNNKSMHLNLRGDAQGSDSRNTQGEQTFITAKILSIEEGVKLLLSPPAIDHNKNKKYIDEDCYPVISGFISHIDYKSNTILKNGNYIRIGKGKTTDSTTGPTCSVIQSDLESQVLVGHGYGRSFTAIPFDYSRYGTRDLIEVRAAGGVEVPSTELKEQCHRISWSNSRDDLRGAGSVTAPRIYYTRGGKLYSQAGLASDTAPKPVTLSASGGYHVDKNYLTHFDNQGVTIYTPDLLSTPFVKGNPTLSDGLGLTGNVTDARTFVDSQNAVYVCVKIAGYWKLVKTSTVSGPESSLLSYDFKKPIGFDGSKIWGIDSDPSGGWDIQYATPFYESSIIGSWVFFANDYTTVTPTETAWGQVVNSRIGETGNNGTPRYLSIDWKMDSGDWFGTGTPTIGLNHQANKMIVENTFKWYPVDIPSSLVTLGAGTVIADLYHLTPPVVNTYTPLASAEISFKSKVYRDIVFFKEQETMLPTGGDTGGENKISFLNYSDSGQAFYVLNDNSFKIVTQYGKEPELAYRLSQAVTGGTVFDASKVGISTFLIGAPNMFNAYGANIDLYYRASFINKWGHESAPSPLPSKGITALDSADDCVQVNFNAPFFRFTDTDIDTIRLYRYGGDSSEFLFLKDIPMPTLPVDSEGTRYFPTISGINSITNGFSRKSATSPYYLLKTNKDISSLSGFTNSNFLLTATPSSMDGSWRVNQVSEAVPIIQVFTGTGSNSSHRYYTSVTDLSANDQIMLSSTGTLPSNFSVNTYYYVNQVFTDYIYIASSPNAGSNTITWGSQGSGVHSLRKIGYETTLAEDLNTTDTTVKLVNAANSSAWPTSGIIKLGAEYISYGAISSNDLTGCVRGVHDTNASDHKGGRNVTPYSSSLDFNITNAGTGYGYVSSGVYSSADKSFAFQTGHISQMWLNSTGHGFADDVAIMLKPASGAVMPAGFSSTTVYYVQNLDSDGNGTPHADLFQISSSPGGSVIDRQGSDLGSGSFSLNGCILTASTGGFVGSYTVNTSTGAIATASIIYQGSGYTSVPTVLISDPGIGQTGASAVIAASLADGVTANVVEWELEMEHRNQDTTTLTEAISAPLTGTTNVINVTDTSVFPAASASGSPGPKKLLIGSEILTYTGKTDTTFTGVTPATEGTIASTHGLNVLVRSYDEVYATTTVTNASIEIEGFGFRDKARTPISSLYSMGLDNFPPLGLEYNVEKKQFFETESEDDYFRYIKAVGSMYFGAIDADLRFSRYGTPEYWPVDAVITLDSEIRWIEEHAGEGLVFTTNSLYRVRGTDPKAMVAFRVPDARGLPAGYEHTVSDFNGGLIWLTASDGICMYSAGRATYLTRDKHDIGKLKAPYSCVVDGAYWLFQEPGSGNGYRLELATGEMRLAQTTIEAYYAYFAKPLGVGVVVTKDNTINPDRDSEFLVEEIGGDKASNIEWKSKKIDAGEPAIPKALGSIAIVYEVLNSTSAETLVGGIRGQALAAELLGLDPEDLDAGDIDGESETITDLYSIFTKYDEPNQTYIVETDGANLTNTERRTILMPVGFDTSSVTVGNRVWNEMLADNTEVESLTTTTISGVVYPSIVLNKEPLRTGEGTIYWGNLPIVEIYLNNDDTPSRVFTLPPGDVVEPQSMDLYLNDLKRFRTISVGIKGDVRVQSLSLRHYPLQRYQSSTLHHSADVFYKGDIDFRIMLDGSLVYRKELSNAGDDFTEERIYLPASSFGQRAHYMNESRAGMIESVNFNGSVAA